MARTIATFAGGPSRGALIGEQAGGAFQQAFQESLGQRREQQRFEELGAPLAAAMQQTGNPFLQALPPEMLARYAATPQGAAMLAKSTAPPEMPAGPARDLKGLLDLHDDMEMSGRTRSASIVSGRIDQFLGQKEGETDRKLRALSEVAGLQPGSPEYQQAALQVLGAAPPEGAEGQIIEGRDADGQPAFFLADRRTGELQRLEGAAPRPTAQELSADLARKLSEQGPAEPGESLIPEDIDVAAALGAGGFARNAFNAVADMFGRGTDLPAAETSRAREALTNLQVLTRLMLQEGVPGRPSNMLMEQLDRLTVTPTSIFTGAGRALDRFEATRRMIQTEVGRIENEVLARPDVHDARALRAASNNRTQLSSLLDAYSQLIINLESGGPTPSGVDAEVWRAMTPEERALFR